MILVALVLMLGLHTGPEPSQWVARPEFASQFQSWHGIPTPLDGASVSLSCPF